MLEQEETLVVFRKRFAARLHLEPKSIALWRFFVDSAHTRPFLGSLFSYVEHVIFNAFISSIFCRHDGIDGGLSRTSCQTCSDVNSGSINVLVSIHHARPSALQHPASQSTRVAHRLMLVDNF